MLEKLSNLRAKADKEEGFTLIELMIVVVIIGILAAVALPIFATQQRSAIKAGIKSDVRNIQTQVVTYLVKNPTAENLSYQKLGGSATATGPLADNGAVKASPSDDKTNLKVRAANVDPVGNWSDWGVIGWSNAASNGGEYRYSYNSQTGKYTEGDTGS
jgi:prepilin-type N-terminal cleavage/methylation domain-containing protein